VATVFAGTVLVDRDQPAAYRAPVERTGTAPQPDDGTGDGTGDGTSERR
jgi:hypothetical protein